MTIRNSKIKSTLIAAMAAVTSIYGYNTTEASQYVNNSFSLEEVRAEIEAKTPDYYPNVAQIRDKEVIEGQIQSVSEEYSNVDEGWMEFTATAYVDGGYSASGVCLDGRAWDCIAVDPRVIPLGSTVYIEFYGEFAGYSGYFKAVDTGGLVKNNIIDVHVGVGNYDEAYRFGRRSCRLKIVS